MVGDRRVLTIADLRKAIATSLRNLAGEVTDGLDPAASKTRRQLYAIANRYEDGVHTDADAEAIVRLHAWVVQLTAEVRP